MNKKIIFALLMIAPLSSYGFFKNHRHRFVGLVDQGLYLQNLNQLAPDVPPAPGAQDPTGSSGQNPEGDDQQIAQFLQQPAPDVPPAPGAQDQPRGASQNPEGDAQPRGADQNPEGDDQPRGADQNPEGDAQQAPDGEAQAPTGSSGQNPEGDDQPRGASQNGEGEEDNKDPTQTVVVEEDNKDLTQTVVVEEDNKDLDQTVVVEEDNKDPTQTVVAEEEKREDPTSKGKTDQVDSNGEKPTAPSDKKMADLPLTIGGVVMDKRKRKLMTEDIKAKTTRNKDYPHTRD
jgi:hypothetical protein